MFCLRRMMDGEGTMQKIKIFVDLGSDIIQMLIPRKIVRKSDSQVMMIRGAINLFAINGVCVTERYKNECETA